MRDFPYRLRAMAVAAIVAPLLAACGGGGGGGAAPNVPAPAEPVPVPPEAAAARLSSANSARVLARANSVGESLPGFGSVTQSTNRGGDGITTDTVSAALEDGRLTVTVAREGAGALVLDTTGAVEDSGVYPTTSGDNRARDWRVVGVSNDSAVIARIAALWEADAPDSDAPDDYVVAAGYWLHFEGDILSGIVADAGMGAFIDGPAFSAPPPDLPEGGSVSYRGGADGFYGARYGTDAAGVASGSTVVGEFGGTATLTADFSAGTISGCVGCEGGLALDGTFRNGSTGAVRDFEQDSNAAIHLDAIPIDPAAGWFRGPGVRVENPELSDGADIVESEGRWGGRFSDVLEENGDPRWIAGTFAGRGVTEGGTASYFVGAFSGGDY